MINGLWKLCRFLILAATVLACKSVGSGEDEKHVNILFVMADQHRADFVGAAGAEWLKTPSLDLLASEGVRFSKCYASVPSCTPARTSILIGLSTWNHGMLGYTNSIDQHYELEMPRFFTENGYRTHAVGKNHFGPPRNTHGYQTIELEEAWYSATNGFVCDYR